MSHKGFTFNSFVLITLITHINNYFPDERVCEGSKLSIRCPAGESIYILNANYGRTLSGNEVCQNSKASTTTNTSCKAANSAQIVSSM